MSTTKNSDGHSDVSDELSETGDSAAEANLTAEIRRRRLAVLTSAKGLWKDRTDIPADGVEYQRTLRQEWNRDE